MDKSFLEKIKELKKNTQLEIVDTHIHPQDVMGVVHYSEYENAKNIASRIDYDKPGLMETLHFGRAANFLSNNLFNLFKKTVAKEIRVMFSDSDQERLLSEMDFALIDRAVFLPVEPWTGAAEIRRTFDHERFILLGSVDIHRLSAAEIEASIAQQVAELGIVGIKLHPNLQDFYPQPSDNPRELAEKLKTIYSAAEKHSLYLLFHGGISSFTEHVNDLYQNVGRSKKKALLEKFSDASGQSEIFGQYDAPIIIAHLGHFGLNKLDAGLLKAVIAKHPKVYFDTAACSPSMIAEFIKQCGHERLVLGSDAIYNKMMFAIYFVYSALKKLKYGPQEVDKVLSAVLGDTYNKKILNHQYGSNLQSD